MPKVNQYGSSSGNDDTIQSIAHCEQSARSECPGTASKTLSDSDAHIRRAPPAPIAARTASSRCREAPRTSIRLARFAHMINSTKPTAVIRMTPMRSTPESTYERRIGTTCTPKPRFMIGYCSSSRCAIDDSSDWNWPIVTPGFNNAIALMLRAERGDSSHRNGMYSWSVSGNLIPGGSTPITTRARSLTVIALPMIAGSDPYRLCHRPCVSITTDSRPGAAASSGRNWRPMNGSMPSIGNKSVDTDPPRTRSALDSSPLKTKLRSK